MSKYKVIKTTFTDVDLLLEAIEAVGVPCEVAPPGELLPLYGYRGDRRPERANVVIRRRNISVGANDVGFAVQPDGSIGTIISEFDSHSRGQRMVNSITQQYAVLNVTRLAEAGGYTVCQEKDGVGAVHLRLTRY
jgi:hypothetical protein